MMRLRQPGGRQLIWMLLIIVLAEWLLILSCQCQNPLFFAQFFWAVSIYRARLGICARNTFHKGCYGNVERQGKGCWDMVKGVENETNLMICLSSCSIPGMSLQKQMLFLILLSSSCFHDKGIQTWEIGWRAEQNIKTTWDLWSSLEAKLPQPHHQKALCRTETLTWRR